MLLLAVFLAAAPTLAQQEAVGLAYEELHSGPLQPNLPMKLFANTVVLSGSAPEGAAGQFERLLYNGACAGEITVTGRVISKRPSFTPNRMSIYTVYEFVIDEVLRGVLPRGEPVYLLRAGGTISESTGTYSMEYSDQPPFDVNGRYLVYITHDNGFYRTSPFDWKIIDDTVVSAGQFNKEPRPLSRAVAAAREMTCAQ